MDEMKLLRDRAGAQPEPPPEVVAAALGRLLAETREPSPPPSASRPGWFARPVRRARAGTTRSRMTRGVMATVALAMVVVAGMAAVAARDSGDEGHMMMAYTGAGSLPAWREGNPEIVVWFCGDDSYWPNCGGRGLPEGDGPPEAVGTGKAATPQQVAAARQALAAMPQVQAVTFVTRQERYDRFRRHYPPPKMATVTAADMSESFEVKLKRDADAGTVLDAAGRLPGMSFAIDLECSMRGFLHRLFAGGDECRSKP
ncbi:permease-like cell division protein FtsX [Nonomuraea sp. NPDC047897]|uniref:permease-like cell division protein FtsX n=1 Tax=Nonomuraea sp. NPDC047897 TaxID=3364346 RepID=UPI003715DE34